MIRAPRLWAEDPTTLRYRDLDHPADLWVEVYGDSLSKLAENALFALFDTLVATQKVNAKGSLAIEGAGAGPAEALRSLLAEALFAFDSERFAAAGAEVEVETAAVPPQTLLRATLWGEHIHPDRHELRTEVKAVTHHLLRAEPHPAGGWRASVLFDV